MRIRTRDLLGKSLWFVKTNDNDNASYGSWNSDPQATLDEVLQGISPEARERAHTFGGLAYCEQWQKVGRRIDRVRVREIAIERDE